MKATGQNNLVRHPAGIANEKAESVSGRQTLSATDRPSSIITLAFAARLTLARYALLIVGPLGSWVGARTNYACYTYIFVPTGTMLRVTLLLRCANVLIKFISWRKCADVRVNGFLITVAQSSFCSLAHCTWWSRSQRRRTRRLRGRSWPYKNPFLKQKNYIYAGDHHNLLDFRTNPRMFTTDILFSADKESTIYFMSALI